MRIDHTTQAALDTDYLHDFHNVAVMPEKRLLWGVLIRAWKDSGGRLPGDNFAKPERLPPFVRTRVFRWARSRSEAPFSLRWIAGHLFDPWSAAGFVQGFRRGISNNVRETLRDGGMEVPDWMRRAPSVYDER